MRIHRLWISSYKNLNDQTFNFKPDPLITLLVGQNGLGKSNLIEVISIIFQHIDISNSHSEFYGTIPDFDFEIEYTCKKNLVQLSLKNGQYKIKVKSAGLKKMEAIEFNDFMKMRLEYLPDFIICYYSGENKRVKKIFERHELKWETRLRRNAPTSQSQDLGRLFFTDQNLGELVFFTLWTFKNSEKYGTIIKSLFTDFLDIELNTKIELTFQNPIFAKKYPDFGALKLADNMYVDETNLLWGLTGRVSNFIKILINSCDSFPIGFEDKELVDDKNVNEFVLLNSLDFDSLSKNIKELFPKPINLFDVLVATSKLNLINKIDSLISKNGQTINHDFTALSEGEQQLLTILGLVLMIGENDALFLFDEPDTHLNPKWQRDLVYLLKEYNLDDENSQIIVSTHSPLIVQSSENADVFLFKRTESGITVDNDNHKIHNWRIDQVLVSDYFELKSARPKRLDELMEERESILSKEKLGPEDYNRLKEIEAEEGVFPTGETITDIKTLRLFREIVNSFAQK